MTKPMNENDRKFTASEKLAVYDGLFDFEKHSYGSAEYFCGCHDIYVYTSAPSGSFYFVDKALPDAFWRFVLCHCGGLSLARWWQPRLRERFVIDNDYENEVYHSVVAVCII